LKINKQNRERGLTIKKKFATLLRGASSRGISVYINLAEYTKIISTGICHYYPCVRPLPKHGGGVDRKNSCGSYYSGNCVPCCSVCNEIKGHDNVSYEEMFEINKTLHRLRYGTMNTEDDDDATGFKSDEQSGISPSTD
jgi:hypothetical protein